MPIATALDHPERGRAARQGLFGFVCERLHDLELKHRLYEELSQIYAAGRA